MARPMDAPLAVAHPLRATLAALFMWIETNASGEKPQVSDTRTHLRGGAWPGMHEAPRPRLVSQL